LRLGWVWDKTGVLELLYNCERIRIRRYWMISQNGHQEEDQEGIIRLRNNNVVHFVSDGHGSNNKYSFFMLA
jgi:hypothetical protein